MKFYNKTRKTKSIPLKLLKCGKWHLIPLYFLFSTSYLASEGIKNGGSYKFADHVYNGKPKGRFLIGSVLDSIFLNMPSAKAMRFRYKRSKQELKRIINNSKKRRLDVLAIPSGLGREIFEANKEIGNDQINYHFIDLDKGLINKLGADNTKNNFFFHSGDALDKKTYYKNFDIIVSLGMVDFLDDRKTLLFYKIIKNKLNKGGFFISSGMREHKLTNYLLKNLGELNAVYRSTETLIKLSKRAGFRSVKTYEDKTGLQTMVIAKK
ncbi:MAG: class I SAM-dependent methyltransferase family protein [Nanoarchaeota archaeon]